jgi:hypothetical protein
MNKLIDDENNDDLFFIANHFWSFVYVTYKNELVT